MNIEFQLCGFLICALLLFFYIGKRSMQLYSERIFFCILVMTLLLITMDMVSVVAIAYRNRLPELLVEMICKLYASLLVIEGFMALVYILVDVLTEKKHRRVLRILSVLVGIQALFIYLLPIGIFSEGRCVYTYGPSIILVYASAVTYLVSAIVVAYTKRRKINARRLLAFSLWVGIWLVAAVIQFLDNTKLIVGFAASLGMIILYVVLENPESNINWRIGCFNAYALEKYLKQLFERNAKFHIIEMSFVENSEEKESLIRKYIKEARSHKEVLIFKRIDMTFIFITTKEEEYERLRKWFALEQKRHTRLLRDIQLLCLKNGLSVREPQNIQGIFQYYQKKLKGSFHMEGNEITPAMVEEYLNQGIVYDEIQSALAENRVEVFLQPIYSVAEKKYISAEALVRIRRTDGSILPPGDFIPVAESSGLIIELGERIFELTCRLFSENLLQQQGIRFVEINLSVVQCEYELLSQNLIRTLDRYGVNPSQINLEITETATMSARKKLLANMEQLLEKGCSFSLDDFGKGESNLMYLVEMPVTTVKLDYDMTKAFFKIKKAKNVVNSVIRMAHDMGMSVVAEGIETKEEFEHMVSLGVDYIQGFYFSRPLPLLEFLMETERDLTELLTR